MSNSEVEMSLDEAVDEVLGLLTGLDLAYSSEFDRYRAIARQLNRALRNNAMEHEWSYYSTVLDLGPAVPGMREVHLPSGLRARVIKDDSVRFVTADGVPMVWAYILPRDALHKHSSKPLLYASVTRRVVEFSKALSPKFSGLSIQLPVMREP